jgi:hypothetical protein
MHANCPPESGGQRHRVLCDDARGGSSNEMSQYPFLTSSAQEPLLMAAPCRACIRSAHPPGTISTAVSIVLPS